MCTGEVNVEAVSGRDAARSQLLLGGGVGADLKYILRIIYAILDFNDKKVCIFFI